MPTYQYTDSSKTAVFIIDPDGVKRTSALVESLPENSIILDIDPPPIEVPQSVTMRQARLALLAAGLLDDVNALLNSLPSPQREAAIIEWEYSQEVQRHNGFVALISPQLSMSDEQIDQLFILAKSL